jgi:predicted nucleic acid-binding protein
VPLLYLDYNCFQRGFDDLRQLRIRREAEACQKIFTLAESGQVDLIWSFIHDEETALCPFPTRRAEALRSARLCGTYITHHTEILFDALEFQQRAALSAKDALHLASATFAKAEILLTCDDSFRKRALRLKLNLPILNPSEYIDSL